MVVSLGHVCLSYDPDWPSPPLVAGSLRESHLALLRHEYTHLFTPLRIWCFRHADALPHGYKFASILTSIVCNSGPVIRPRICGLSSFAVDSIFSKRMMMRESQFATSLG